MNSSLSIALLLCAPVLAQPLQAPADGTVVVTRQNSLSFRWNLPPARGYRVELWNQGRSLKVPLPDVGVTLSLTPNQSYTWKSYAGDQLLESSTFSVTDQFVFESLGRDGLPGILDREPQDGKAGGEGGSLRVDLCREGSNLNLEIKEQARVYHYLLADTDRKFLISARGGAGGKGSDGLDFGGPLAVAGNGGAGGWGGHIEVTVHQLPWRLFLDLDVSAGAPGVGGHGGREGGTDMHGHTTNWQNHDGQPGPSGHPGIVITHIQP